MFLRGVGAPPKGSWQDKPKAPRGEFGYHATFLSYLPRIRRLGLVPRAESGQERRAEWEDEDAVYFIAPFSFGVLHEYGPVFLRFPHPKEWAYGDLNPDVYPFYEALTERVLPGQIEVFTKACDWKPLAEVADADVWDGDDVRDVKSCRFEGE